MDDKNKVLLSAITKVLFLTKSIDNGFNVGSVVLPSNSIFLSQELFEESYFAGELLRVFKGFFNIEDFIVRRLIEAEILEPTGDFYYIGDEEEFYGIKVEKYTEYDVTEFYLEGDLITDHDLLLEKYKIHSSIVDEAKQIFESVKDYIEKEKFTFINSGKYEVPLYAGLIFNALELVNQKKSYQSIDSLKDIHRDENAVVELLKKYSDTYSLSNMGVKKEGDGDWRDTIELLK